VAVLVPPRKRLSAVFFLVLFAGLDCIGPASSQAVDLPPLRPQGSPEFVADVAISLDADGRPALAVTVSVPHGELQWLRTPIGFAAGADLTVVFEPRGKGREYGDSWERRVVVNAFETTNSSMAALVERRVFAVPPGRYELRVQVSDVNSDVASTVRERIDVPDYSKVDVGFADLEIGRVDSAGVFTAVPARRFGPDVDRLAARVVLFDRRAGAWPRTYPFRYRILDEAGGEVITGRRDLSVGHSAEPVLVKPDSSALFLGGYVFEVELQQGKSKWRVERSFDVEESGPPRGREFERILEPLALIAEPNEIEYLRSLAPEDQVRGWEDFWKRRDPTPETSRNEALLEFFRRIRYVEQRFRGFGPGWRSDMGRVYIKFGAPDQIENRPATSQSPQVEIWYYNRPSRRFVFADRDGFGRYVLVTPMLD
jgi:GWxTD domain-containing protein